METKKKIFQCNKCQDDGYIIEVQPAGIMRNDNTCWNLKIWAQVMVECECIYVNLKQQDNGK